MVVGGFSWLKIGDHVILGIKSGPPATYVLQILELSFLINN